MQKLIQATNFNDNEKFYGKTFLTAKMEYQKRWEHWMRKLMQLGILEDVFSLDKKLQIPFEDYDFKSNAQKIILQIAQLKKELADSQASEEQKPT